MSDKFDAATYHLLDGLLDETMDEFEQKDGLRESAHGPDNDANIRSAIRVLEAAGKVDARGWKSWLAWYGTNHTVVPMGLVEFIDALPEEEK